jgi:hypothetical protein
MNLRCDLEKCTDGLVKMISSLVPVLIYPTFLPYWLSMYVWLGVLGASVHTVISFRNVYSIGVAMIYFLLFLNNNMMIIPRFWADVKRNLGFLWRDQRFLSQNRIHGYNLQTPHLGMVGDID